MSSDPQPRERRGSQFAARSPIGPRGLIDVRRQNLTRVLGEIRDRPGVTRKDLVSLTSLNRVTVLDLVAELQEQRLVDESPAQSTGRSGRPAMTLSLDDQRLAVAALEINIDRIRIRCTTLRLRSLHDESVPVSGGSLDPERVLDLAAECIDRARSEMARQGLELTRVSVGLPAIIDHRSGTVQTSLDFRWGEVPVVDRLQQRTGGDLSFTLDRLANLAIREERSVAGLRPDSGVVLLFGGMGVGGAFQKGDVILRGDTGIGAEFGHISVDPEGPECYCGGRGCLEMYVGIRPLAAVLGIGAGEGAAGGEEILAQISADDPDAREAVRAQAPWLARAVRILRTVFDPTAVVLGGHLADLARLMDSALVDAMAIHGGGGGGELRISTAGGDAVLAGGVRAARDQLLAAPWES